MYVHVILWVVVIASTYATLPSDMTKLMDRTINPCDNFYKYSCGGWIEKTILHPSERELKFPDDEMTGDKWEILFDIIDENHPILSEFWHSCLDTNKLTQLGNKPLQKDLNHLLKANTIIDIMKLAGEFSRVSSKAIITYEVKGIVENPTIYSLVLNSAQLILPSTKYYSNHQFPTIEKEYREYIDQLIHLSGMTIKNTLIPSEIVVRIEKQLATIIENTSNQPYHQVSVAHLVKQWPNTIEMYLKGAKVWDKLSTMNDVTIRMKPFYFDALEHLIHKTPLDEFKVYIAFLMIHNRVNWLGHDFFQLWFKFFETNLNGFEEPDRDGYCLESLRQSLPDLLGDYYYKKTFDHQRQNYAIRMVKHIQEAMEKQISNSTLLNKDGQKEMVTKLTNVLTIIGKSNAPRSHPSVLSRYDYPANMYTILSHTFDTSVQKIGQRINREETTTSPVEFNAFYKQSTNAIYFPAAFLQPPLFNGDQIHPARNFGGIGTTVGHELTHAFVPFERMMEGNKQMQSWRDSIVQKYDDRMKCYRQQYSAIKVHGKQGRIGNVNGTLTLDENVADNAGFKVAWNAYREYMSSVESQTHDTTLNEGDQMFFISFAQSFCSQMQDQQMKRSLDQDVHTPSEPRVNAVMMNNQDFATIFKCKVNTPMNPEKKCHLW